MTKITPLVVLAETESHVYPGTFPANLWLISVAFYRTCVYDYHCIPWKTKIDL